MPDAPRTLGTYTLTRLLGAGGMGEVYLARDPRLEREVALKVLPEELHADPERRQRFLREARAVAKLAHPNIAAIHEIGEAGGRDYIAFEYIDGRTLQDHLRGRPLPLGELVELALPLVDALAYAHERGIVHRDLKAANVVVSSRGHPKLLDFGLAKMLHPDGVEREKKTTTLTLEGAIFGTPHAMSPEQALGRAVDARSDVFAFGSLLYEMAAGRPAFTGATAMEILDAVIHAEPPPLGSVRPDVPPELAAIVAKALRKDPGVRYQHMTDLAADLRHLERTTDSGLVPPASTRSRRGLLVAGGVATVGVVALALYRTLGPGAPGGASPASAADLAAAPVGVLGFENLSDPSDPRHLNRMLMGLVTTDLAESGGLEVVSTPRILSALREVGNESGRFDAARASQAAERAGVRAMLVGQIAPRDEGMLLSAELVDVDAGRTLGSWTREAHSDAELFELAKTLGDGVRASLGRPATPASESIDLAGSLTASVDAYRQFAAGELALHEFRFEQAVSRFEQALQLDPSFALASYRLGMALSWLGRGEEANAVLRAGLAHVGRLPGRWQAICRAEHARNDRNYDEAYRELMAVADSAADLADFHNCLGEVLTHGYRYLDPVRAREAFERTLAVDPSFKVALHHLTELYLLANDEAATERLVTRFTALDPADPAAAASEAALCLARGDVARAVEVTERAGHEGTTLFSRAVHAYLLAGELERAERVSEAAMARSAGYQRSLARMDRVLVRLAAGRFAAVRADLGADLAGVRAENDGMEIGGELGMAAWILGEPGSAVADLREALREYPYNCSGWFWLGFLLCEGGEVDAAAEALAGLATRAEESVSPLFHFWRPLLASVVLHARGDLAGARRELANADAQPIELRDRGLAAMLRARLATAAGERDLAIAAWRELLDPSYLRCTSYAQRNLPWRPIQILAHYELARLEEERGALDTAREHYGRFLAYWGAADLPLPSIADARARLAKLEGR